MIQFLIQVINTIASWSLPEVLVLAAAYATIATAAEVSLHFIKNKIKNSSQESSAPRPSE